MAISNIKACFSCGIEKVWDTVTSLENYSWRSDLGKINCLNETQFVEQAKDGFETVFTVTCCEKYKRWEFDMDNSNMKGHWTGLFSFHNNETTVDFTEAVTAKKWWMKPLVGMYLKKQQAVYVEDLRRELGSAIGEKDKQY